MASAVFDRREGFVVAVFLVSLLAVATVFVTVRRASLDVARRLPSDILAAGEESVVVLDVRTESWDASIQRWRDVVPGSFGPAPAGDADALTAASVGGSVRASYLVRPERRGEFVLGPLVVTREDPFGLVQAERSSTGGSDVVVTPRVVPLLHSELIQASGEGARHEHRMSSHPRVDELIAREYRAGDPMRRIHWRATARRGELMVRQEEQEVDPAIVLVLDTAAGEPGARPDPGAFELMVELTASIAVHALGAGFRLTLVESVPRDTDAARRFEPSQSADVLTRLAVVEPIRRDEDTPDIAAVTRDVLDRAGAPVPVIAVLADGSVPSVRRLVPIARLADPAVAFVPPDDAGRAELGSGGWITGVLGAGRTVSDIWNETVLLDPLVRERER
ncbi:DUF58 domain-containing protein [Labedella endophytica]|uniref:DUF58 domain-containing protein n=1 Tax=Labedella endophytica TaxID=1523160 RepID=A0A433JNH6_9MICO|nr:DUF58 domain-containing protein [Labedella endophytica]RUQ97594.1 DUF58 domain-containing protein [Labedella endophytica]